MAITRIKTDNISNQAVTTDKLADLSVTGGKLANNLTYGSDLIVSGDLTVMGATTTVESTTVTVADPLLVLASGQSGAAAVDAGLVIERGTDSNVALIWDESADQFVVANTTETGTTSGNVTISSYADLRAATITADTTETGNLSISGNTITATNGNGDITLTPDGTGAVIVSAGSELQIADLTAGRVLVAGADGAVVDSAGLTYDPVLGNLSATQAELGDLTFSTSYISSGSDINLSADGGAGVIYAGGSVISNVANPVANSDAATKDYVDQAVSSGGTTISQDDTSVTATDDGTNPGVIELKVDNSTVLSVGPSGATVTGSLAADNLTLSGNTLSSTNANGDITLDPNGTGVIDLQGTVTVSGLTSGQVLYAGANGALVSESGFEYDATTNTLSAPTVTATSGLSVGSLTSGKVVITGASGALAVDADLSYDTATDTLGASNVSATNGVKIGSLTSGRVLLAGADGAVVDSAGLAYSSNLLTTGDLTLSTAQGGTGALTAVSGTFSDLTATRIPFAGVGGLLSDDADFTYTTGSDTLTVTNITSTGTAALGTVKSSNLTSGRVVFATTNGELTDEAGFEYDSATDTLTVGNVAMTGVVVDTLDVNVSATIANLTVEDLTSGRVVLAGAGGELVDNSTLLFNTGTSTFSAPNINGTTAITTPSMTVSGLTSGRVVLAGASGLLSDDAGMTYNTATDTLTVGTVVADLTGQVSDISNHDTDDLAEGVSNLYFTTTRARNSISAGGDLSYDSANGVVSYTTPSTDGVTEGTNNLYFTQTRARNSLAAGTGVGYDSATGTISIGQAVGTTDSVTFNTVTADLVGDVTGTVSSIANHDTDDLSEGTSNLYYTDTRSRSALAAGTGVSYNSTTGTFSIGQAVGTTDNVTFNTVTADLTGNVTGNVTGDLTGDVTATDVDTTNLSVTGSADFGSVKLNNVADPTAAQDAATKNYVDTQVNAVNTLTVSDGTNSDAISVGTDTFTIAGTANEVETAVTNNTVTIGLPSDVTIGNDLTVTGDLSAATADIAGAADVGGNFSVATNKFTVDAVSGNTTVAGTLGVTGNVTLTGNLTVNGTTTTVNSTDLTVTDKNITIADGSANAAAANGAGITVAGASATITYTSIDDRWNLNKDLNVSMVYGDVTGDVTGTVSDISNHDTDALSEGTSNLYFTNTRARSSLAAGTGVSYDSATGTISIGQAVGTTDNVTFNQVTADVIGTVSSLNNHDTDDLSEGISNLYYTDTRSRSALAAGTGVSYNSATGTISIGQAVGTTDNVTFNQVTADVIGTVSDISNHDTDALAEGTSNLYYTDTRSRSALSGGTGVTYSTANGTISIGQAVGTTDNVTFNQVTADVVGDITGTVSDLSNHDTDALSEGLTNLYYTDARSRAALSVTDAGGDGSLSYNSGTGVLTYTGPSAAEVRAHLSAGTGVTYNSATGAISIGQAVGTGDSVTFSSLTAGTINASGVLSGYIFYAGASGQLKGESTFTYDEATDKVAVSNIEATNVTVFAVPNTQLVYSDNGALAGSSDFVLNTGTATLSATNLDTSGTATIGTVDATTVKVSGLTAGRIVVTTTDGELEDDLTLTFDSTTDTVTASNIDVTGVLTGGTIKANGLTSGRVVFATTDGTLTDDSTFLFDNTSDTLTATNLSVTTEATFGSAVVSDLTMGRVVLAGTSGAISDSASLLFDAGSGALTVTGSVSVDNININGNTISSTDSNGNITLSPNGTGSIDASTSYIINVIDPVNAQDAATKAYVDDAVSANVTKIAQNNTSVEVIDNNISAGVVEIKVDAALTAKFTDTALEIYNTLEVDNIKLDTNTISTTDLNGDLFLAPNGSGSVVVDTGKNFKVSDLGSGQIVYAGTDGLIKSEAGFEYDDTTNELTAQNVVVNSALTLSTFTQNSVLFAGASGVVSEDADLTWNGTDFTVNGGLVVIGDADIDNININGNTISTTDTDGNLVLQPNGLGAVVVNDAGNSSDFRVKSVNQTHMLFVDASADVIGIKTNTPNAEAAIHIATTDSIIVPVGTQAQRPGTAATGMFRFNTTAEKLEVYDGTQWVNIGANNTTTVTSETFAGDGATVNFTLAQNSTTASVVVSINGVVQIPGTAYSVSGTTLTFTEAPETGDTVEVRTLVTAETVQTVIGSDDGTSLVAYDSAGDQFVFTVASSTIAIVDDKGIDLRSGAAIICGDASTAVGTTATTVDSFAKADYRVAKYVAQISNVGLGEYQAVELLVVHNGTTATVTEYAEVFTGSASLGSFSATVSGANVEVKFTGANAGNTVKVMPTFIKA